MDNMTKKDFSKLQKRIGYTFSDDTLLTRAVIHSSADIGESYERLEFLGDAVLELTISEYLFSEKTEYSEGEMTKSRAALVNEGALVKVAKDLELREYVILGRGERNSGGAEKPSILADIVEALFGAVYIDGGFEEAKRIIHSLLGDSIDTVLSGGGLRDYKTRLQEHYQKLGTNDIKYTVYKEEGPPHNKVFYVKLYVDGQEMSKGQGRSKKIAEQKAAKSAFVNVVE